MAFSSECKTMKRGVVTLNFFTSGVQAQNRRPVGESYSMKKEGQKLPHPNGFQNFLWSGAV